MQTLWEACGCIDNFYMSMRGTTGDKVFIMLHSPVEGHTPLLLLLGSFLL